MRPVAELMKKRPLECSYNAAGHCMYGDDCGFAHGPQDTECSILV